MSGNGKEGAKHPLANLPEKHRKAFTIGYLLLMGLVLAAGAIAHFVDEKEQ